MQLTAQEILQEGLVTGFTTEGIQQQGIDVRLMSVRKFGHRTDAGSFVPNFHFDSIGVIKAQEKTKLPSSEPVETVDGPDGKRYFILSPGYYEVIFDEGVKMPNNRVMVLISRSSLVRCGAYIECGQFDAGFETDHIGCFMKVEQRIAIEEHARIAQLRFTKTEAVGEEDLYNGQWQGDKQRENQ